ncbi:class I SAM-dependent methyltransferase [Salipiger abyssi]|uniref:Putative O-methyltransferase n=1 Tax=Salipiger abyssi TaxID=1250539 RepID=A0A1P8UUT2_9RHOB|nr:class I SAM-dependent methyltransferase [Salipiger abyssi]APZ53154.1 putative O-methyltransferase [Salipiger abyssi]
MSTFDLVTRTFSDIPYMDESRAALLRSILREYEAREILEIGFYQGKSSVYIGAMLEDFGSGRLVTIDKATARDRSPNIFDLMKSTGLERRITPRFAERSYTWELQRMINSQPRPQFDLCYFDGGHQWDRTGFGVVLVDMLLKPGGLLVLDDMNWSMAGSAYHRKNPETMNAYSEDERSAKTVRLAWDTLLPHLGYSHIREYPAIGWGVARKNG